ncbi:C2H2-type zinc finger protein [Endozoicomonas sp. 8E]|uniref:C2H2-type zinc finger protein n=1 Tax=Endozoicomonas sp. 8E TaxID=3035692 RepID=UPI0029395449|nr:C2H2-type zinc finger protein [Endozoicomonas sp. 8E]WOG27063.1 C2H2-type zinc finger protein [Endozoicomonas sp. 8E]
MLLWLTVICQAKPLTGRLIVELEQSTGSLKKNVSVNHDRHKRTGRPSGIADKNDCAELHWEHKKKRHRDDSYGMKTTFIGSISWQWLYATNLLIAYELILTRKDTPPSSIHSLWFLVVGWLLKSYWNPDLSMFNPIGHQEAASILTQIAINTMKPGDEHDPQQGQSSESSGQQTAQSTTHIRGYFTSLLYSDSADDEEAPEQYSHTLGLNCFIHPCHGVCRFRPASDSSSCNATNGVAPDSTGEGVPHTTDPYGQATCNVILIGENGQLLQCGKVFKNAESLSTHKKGLHTGQQTCDVTVVGEDGQQQSCGMACKNAKALSNHKRRDHSGVQTCPECQKTLPNAIALSNHKRRDHSGAQTCPECQKTLPNAKALSNHKSEYHTGQQTCPECQKTLPNAKALSNHKSEYHTGAQTCPECQKTLPNAKALSGHKRRDHTGAQTCPECQKTLPNAKALSNHKSEYHTGQQTCPECQKTLPNAKALSNHKSEYHTGQQTCPECQKTLPNAQALSRHKRRDHTKAQTCPECQKILPNAKALSDHKRRDHTGAQTCPECQKTLPNAQALSNHKTKYHTGAQTCPECQKTLPNAQALSNHRRQHRKRKIAALDKDNEISPPADKVNKSDYQGKLSD